MVVLSFLSFRLVQELKSILFIEMEGAWMIVCIHHYKSATGLVVLISEPIFKYVQNLRTDETAYTLKLLVNTQTTYQNSRIAAASFGIIDVAIQPVACGTLQISGLNAVIGDSEKANNPSWQFLRDPTIGFSEQFFFIQERIVSKEIIKVLLYLPLST